MAVGLLTIAPDFSGLLQGAFGKPKEAREIAAGQAAVAAEQAEAEKARAAATVKAITIAAAALVVISVTFLILKFRK